MGTECMFVHIDTVGLSSPVFISTIDIPSPKLVKPTRLFPSR